jgi:hypothetical protein
VTVDEIIEELIEDGWEWPIIDRMIDLEGDWKWRMRLRMGTPGGSCLEGRGDTIMEAALDAKNNSKMESLA